MRTAKQREAYAEALAVFSQREPYVVHRQWRTGQRRTIKRRYPLPSAEVMAARYVASMAPFTAEPGKPATVRLDVPGLTFHVTRYQLASKETRWIEDAFATMASTLSPRNRAIMARRKPIHAHIVPARVPLHKILPGMNPYSTSVDGRAISAVGGASYAPSRRPHAASGHLAVRRLSANSVIVEELAHTLHGSLTRAQHLRLENRFDELTAAGGPWPAPPSYRSTSVQEFFAGLAIEYFNARGTLTAGAMRSRDPEMYALFREVFSGWNPAHEFSQQVKAARTHHSRTL